MVNTENVKKWIAALRSGTYTQGCGMLRTPEGKYCCLGVAEHERRAEQDEVFSNNTGLSYYYYPETEKWLGITNVVLKVPTEQLTEAMTNRSSYLTNGFPVAELNDEFGFTFAQIADLIEANYLKEEENA